MLFLYSAVVWIFPVAYIKTRNAQNKKRLTNIYTQEGRSPIHNGLIIPNKWIMSYMAEHPIINSSVEYNDNRVSLFAAQCGKCAITNKNFLTPDEIHCHHKTPRSKGGSDKYDNLVLVSDEVHILIHATVERTIKRYMENLKLNPKQIKKITKLRELVGCEPI